MELLDEVLEAGLPELEDWYRSTKEWPEGVECALGLYPLTKNWADYVSGLMKEKFLEKRSFEWEKLFAEANVPVAAHRTSQEWFSDKEITEMLDAGVVSESWSKQYLPD